MTTELCLLGTNDTNTKIHSSSNVTQKRPGPLCIMLGGRSRDRGGGAGEPGGTRDLGGRGVAERDFAPGESERSDDASLDRESTDVVDIVDSVNSTGGATATGLGGGICISSTTFADGSRTSCSSRRNWKSRPNSCKSWNETINAQLLQS